MLTAWPGKRCCLVSHEAQEGTWALTELQDTVLGYPLFTDANCGKTSRSFNPEELYLSAKSFWNWSRGSILILGCLIGRQADWPYRLFFPTEDKNNSQFQLNSYPFTFIFRTINKILITKYSDGYLVISYRSSFASRKCDCPQSKRYTTFWK